MDHPRRSPPHLRRRTETAVATYRAVSASGGRARGGEKSAEWEIKARSRAGLKAPRPAALLDGPGLATRIGPSRRA
jgi:hypothetical protein